MNARTTFLGIALVFGAVSACSGASSAPIGPDPTSSGGTPGPSSPGPVTNSCGSPGAIAAATDHTCAIVGGALYCWGANDHGALGTGTKEFVQGPARVNGLTGVAAVGVGEGFSCALGSDGAVKCWGQSNYLQLGNGSSADSATPVAVSGLNGIVSIAVGSAHACALAGTGTVACWGNNTDGKLGGGGSVPMSGTPVTVTGLQANAIAAGELDSVALVGGQIEWWGDTGVSSSPTPSPLAGVSNAASLSTGAMFTCFVTSDGAAHCWGYNGEGRLGNGSTADSAVPVDVTGLAAAGSAVAVSTGGQHACALTTSCGVKCWGNNENGQLGDGSKTQSPVPVAVTGLDSGVAAVATGFGHTCAVMKSGGVKCWGSGTWLGRKSLDDSPVPVDVAVQ